jgi:hypothetical protein
MFALAVILASSPAGAAPVTWASGPGANGHQYELRQRPGISWQAAKDEAEALGAGWHLATITSEEEQDWLDENVLGPEGGTGEYWLGGYQVPSDEPEAATGWTWGTGEPWGYVNWGPYEPNDYWEGPGSEQQLAVEGGGDAWRWNDESLGENISGFLAERDAVEPPAESQERPPAPAGEAGSGGAPDAR